MLTVYQQRTKLYPEHNSVMVIVSNEVRSGLPSEFLYADDLVLLAPTMEQIGRH